MPVPRLRGNGTLPLGVHKATLREVRRAFGQGTARRVELTLALDAFMRRVRKAGIRRVLIDGSFVTGKQGPRDIDVVVFLTEQYAARLRRGDPDSRWIERKANEDPPKFIDVFVAIDEEEWESWVGFFERDLWLGRKGLLEVGP